MSKPTNLKSKLKSALRRDLPPAPEQPAPTHASWLPPNEEEIESVSTQRAEGQRALANATPPPAPIYGAQIVTGGSK